MRQSNEEFWPRDSAVFGGPRDEPYGITFLQPVSPDLERRYFEIMAKDLRGEKITEADMRIVTEYSDSLPAVDINLYDGLEWVPGQGYEFKSNNTEGE